jgi:hypothetical protein
MLPGAFTRRSYIDNSGPLTTEIFVGLVGNENVDHSRIPLCAAFHR